MTDSTPRTLTEALLAETLKRDLRGAITDRPAATAVKAGTTYWAIDRLGEADEISVSDGATWSNV